MQKLIYLVNRLRRNNSIFESVFWILRHSFDYVRYVVYWIVPERVWYFFVRHRALSYNGAFSSAINSSRFTEATKNTLRFLGTFGPKYSDHVKLFLECQLKRVIDRHISDGVVCICIVHNELMRMKLFLEHYRSLGVTNFAILDDNSSDGTREFLLSQSDVIVFESPDRYTTVLREVWINRMISDLGLDRWFIIVDSDELLDYPNRRVKSITTLLNELEGLGKSRTRAVMVEMYSPNSVFDDAIRNYHDIPRVNRMFWNKYSFDGFIIRGRTNKALIPGMTKNYCMKYPIIKMREFDFHHTHFDLPCYRDARADTMVALLHYKCVNGDREKYKERAQAEGTLANRDGLVSFSNAIERDEHYLQVVSHFYEYRDFESLRVIRLLRRAR